MSILFQSTLPVRGATLPTVMGAYMPYHFNPRSPCGERHGYRAEPEHKGEISIHAPRAGSDERTPNIRPTTYINFNPRSPCGERHNEVLEYLQGH